MAHLATKPLIESYCFKCRETKLYKDVGLSVRDIEGDDGVLLAGVCVRCGKIKEFVVSTATYLTLADQGRIKVERTGDNVMRRKSKGCSEPECPAPCYCKSLCRNHYRVALRKRKRNAG